MSDLFHPNTPDGWIDDVFAIAALCQRHTFQVLTKRPERLAPYLHGAKERVKQRAITIEPHANLAKKADFCATQFEWPLSNVWVGTTAENQEMADKRICDLLEAPAVVRFVSFEPLLEQIWIDNLNLEGLHWAIIGGESGPKARSCNVDWIRSLVKQCQILDIPVFVKQLGALSVDGARPALRDRKGGDIDEWPEDLQIREFPKLH